MNSGKLLLRLISSELIKADVFEEGTVLGFNLHVSPAIKAHDRQGLERILGYMGRPPLSSRRLQLAPDGKNLILQLKTPWRDGTSSILLSPFELLERLVALIPAPGKNQIRYHGFLGPNAELRGDLLPKIERNGDNLKTKICRPKFADLMWRVFDIDILNCPRCFSRMQLISFIKEARVITSILKSLKMTTAPPEIFKVDEYCVLRERGRSIHRRCAITEDLGTVGHKLLERMPARNFFVGEHRVGPVKWSHRYSCALSLCSWSNFVKH